MSFDLTSLYKKSRQSQVAPNETERKSNKQKIMELLPVYEIGEEGSKRNKRLALQNDTKATFSQISEGGGKLSTKQRNPAISKLSQLISSVHGKESSLGEICNSKIEGNLEIGREPPKSLNKKRVGSFQKPSNELAKAEEHLLMRHRLRRQAKKGASVERCSTSNANIGNLTERQRKSFKILPELKSQETANDGNCQTQEVKPMIFSQLCNVVRNQPKVHFHFKPKFPAFQKGNSYKPKIETERFSRNLIAFKVQPTSSREFNTTANRILKRGAKPQSIHFKKFTFGKKVKFSEKTSISPVNRTGSPYKCQSTKRPSNEANIYRFLRKSTPDSQAKRYNSNAEIKEESSKSASIIRLQFVNEQNERKSRPQTPSDYQNEEEVAENASEAVKIKAKSCKEPNVVGHVKSASPQKDQKEMPRRRFCIERTHSVAAQSICKSLNMKRDLRQALNLSHASPKSHSKRLSNLPLHPPPTDKLSHQKPSDFKIRSPSRQNIRSGPANSSNLVELNLRGNSHSQYTRQSSLIVNNFYCRVSCKPERRSMINVTKSVSKIRKNATSELFYDKPFTANEILRLIEASKSAFMGTKIQFYDIECQIGEGSYGKVYKAKTVLTGQTVAIKAFVKLAFNHPAYMNRLNLEVKIMNQLDHSGVIKLYEVFEDDRFVYLVQEYAQNGDMLSLLKRVRCLKEAKFLPTLKQVVQTIAYINRKNVLHRDIKLDNILLTGKGQAKLCDFGISTFVNAGELLFEHIGTPAYLAPEIIKEQGYTGFKIDVWSLGVTAFIALTGHGPFFGRNIEELQKSILKDQPVFPEETVVSDPLKQLILRMLEKEVDKRPSIAEVAEELEVDIESDDLWRENTIDNRKLEMLRSFGFNEQRLIRDLKKGKMSHGAALYRMN